MVLWLEDARSVKVSWNCKKEKGLVRTVALDSLSFYAKNSPHIQRRSLSLHMDTLSLYIKGGGAHRKHTTNGYRFAPCPVPLSRTPLQHNTQDLAQSSYTSMIHTCFIMFYENSQLHAVSENRSKPNTAAAFLEHPAVSRAPRPSPHRSTALLAFSPGGFKPSVGTRWRWRVTS